MRFGEPSALFLLLLFPLGAALVFLAARRGRTALRRFGIRAPALVVSSLIWSPSGATGRRQKRLGSEGGPHVGKKHPRTHSLSS